MKKYVAYSPSENKITQETDLEHINKQIYGGLIVKTYLGEDKFKLATSCAIRHKYCLVVSRIHHLGSTPKEIFELCALMGKQNIISCDMPYLNEESIQLVFDHTERLLVRQKLQILAMQNHLRSTGYKFGNPNWQEVLTHEVQKKGAQANRSKITDSPEYQKVREEISRLRALGLTLEDIAERLNGQGMRTTKGKHWAANSVHRVCVRHNIVSG